MPGLGDGINACTKHSAALTYQENTALDRGVERLQFLIRPPFHPHWREVLAVRSELQLGSRRQALFAAAREGDRQTFGRRFRNEIWACDASFRIKSECSVVRLSYERNLDGLLEANRSPQRLAMARSPSHLLLLLTAANISGFRHAIKDLLAILTLVHPEHLSIGTVLVLEIHALQPMETLGL